MPASMNNATLIRMIEEMSQPISQLDAHCSTDEIIPSYNALLTAAKANSPDEPFLASLAPIQQTSINAGPMLALLAQLRIALEFLQQPAP